MTHTYDSEGIMDINVNKSLRMSQNLERTEQWITQNERLLTEQNKRPMTEQNKFKPNRNQ